MDVRGDFSFYIRLFTEMIKNDERDRKCEITRKG